jgi:hypothetical protein
MGKYFKYAIGEILLVVIGILIALQINNWNENRKLKSQELKHLKELKSDIQTTIQDIDIDLISLNRAIKSHSIVRDYFLENIPYNDSLAFHFHNCFTDTQLYAKTSALESLKSAGLDVLSSDSLRIQITDFFQIYAKDVSDRGRIEAGLNNFRTILTPYFVRHFKPTKDPIPNRGQWFYTYAKDPPRKWKVLNEEKLFNDTALQLVMDESYVYREGIVYDYNALSLLGTELVENIDKEIKRLQ